MSASNAPGNCPACGEARFRREDFIFYALPSNLTGATAVARDTGYASAAHFELQMRIDVHPAPAGGAPD